ncbi:hypothetical protein [Caldimonas sp. KR1-144]|uniref:hypothetical protein n=1 Tax=Caldimonas sp. KR1-144 TaxID=3400911 RepID=UPI003BFB5088
MTPLRALCLATAGLLLAGCATGYHYSELRGQRYFKAPIDTYPVIISKVDGKSTPIGGPVLVDPGQRAVTLQGPPGGAGKRNVDEVTLNMDVKPCTRYYIVAVKDNALNVDFKPKVDYEESIAGCTPPAK